MHTESTPSLASELLAQYVEGVQALVDVCVRRIPRNLGVAQGAALHLLFGALGCIGPSCVSRQNSGLCITTDSGLRS